MKVDGWKVMGETAGGTAGDAGEPPPLGALTDDLLTADYRVFQRKKGHRFSSDDVATAYVAVNAAPGALRAIDLGCGLGSVLLIVAWKLPAATLVGVEAQEMSFELLRRNVARNGLEARVTIHHGDLRDAELRGRLGSGFDLVTGTPPYFPADAAVGAMDEQRARARIEYRGGVEAYLEAGAALLSPTGVMVLCGAATADRRVAQGAEGSGLQVRRRCDIVSRAGRSPLFSIWTVERARGFSAACEVSCLTLRDAQGGYTQDGNRLREFSGFAPRALHD